VRPVDILIGVIGPMLFQIGEDWKRGTISVAEENRFTTFCERVFALVAAGTAGPLATKDEIRPDTLLLAAPGNRHTLAVRILGLWLASKGARVRVLDDIVDADALIEIVTQACPRFLLISMALAEQVPAVIAIVEKIRALPKAVRPKVLVGGYAVKDGQVPAIPGAVLVADINALPPLLTGKSLSSLGTGTGREPDGFSSRS
jgi:methanogenic corrinoid protein MtbC1